MILLIIYLNYFLYTFDLESLFYAIPFFGLFYGWIWTILYKSHKINLHKKNNTSVEVKYTITSFLVFFPIVYFYFFLYNQGIIRFSFDINIWAFIVWVVFVFLHDAYFYVLHRVLHTKFMMKYVHIIHHKSHPSNIWSSYSFHPIEAVLYAGISTIIFIFDVNIYALLFATLYNDFFTILGHCWYEIFGKGIKGTWFYRWCATTTYHDVHHSHNNWNIWLYFTYLDRICKTRSKDTDKVFDNVISHE